MFAACFITEALVLVTRFFKTFRRVRDNIGNYYSDRVDLFVRWLWVSSLLIIVCGVAGGVMAFLPGWCNTIYMAVGIGTFTYIYISLQNYALNYERVEISAIPDTPGDEDGDRTAPRDGLPTFIDSLEQWRAGNGYRRPTRSAFSFSSKCSCSFERSITTFRCQSSRRNVRKSSTRSRLRRTF